MLCITFEIFILKSNFINSDRIRLCNMFQRFNSIYNLRINLLDLVYAFRFIVCSLVRDADVYCHAYNLRPRRTHSYPLFISYKPTIVSRIPIQSPTHRYKSVFDDTLRFDLKMSAIIGYLQHFTIILTVLLRFNNHRG